MTNLRMMSIMESVKQRLDIVEVISQHLSLNRQNKAICPFHDEKIPSFSVNPKGQYFYCFGCGVGGDVIRFIELHERKPFKEALSMLSELAGVKTQELDADELKVINETRQIQDVLTATAKFYQASLSSDARRYLHENRGFTDETISRFRIGYANGGLKQHLIADRRYSLELCLRAGVLKRRDGGQINDFFYKRIIFPNLKQGRVVHLSGRVLEDKDPKYLHLPGPLRYLFNEDDLLNEEVILTEGVPDCISAVQAGFHAVAVYGTSQFNQDYEDRFRCCKTIYLCFDGDEAGKRATRKVGEILFDKAVVVVMPDGMDLNALLMEQSPDDLKKLLSGGKRYVDMALQEIKSLPENMQLTQLEDFLPKLARLDLFLQSHYRDMIKQDFGLNKKTIDVAIEAGKTDPSKCTSDETVEEKPAFTDEEKQNAIRLLENPNLIGRLSQITDELGFVGEVDNIVVVYLALTSRILTRPISLIVKGDSSGGKSFLVETVARLFPKSEILMFTTVTPKALYHRTDGLSHKALIIFERHGAEESDYSIRSLQSEGKLMISMPVKDPETGQWTSIDKEVPGPVAYIETTTATHLHQENETRCFEIFIDDSPEQTINVHEAQKRRFRPYGRGKTPDIRPWVVAQMLLEPYQVIIPYIDYVEFPQKPLRVRRDHDRFLTLIEVSATLHQYQREKKTIDGVECLVASLEDYAIAYKLASGILQQTIKQITPKAEELALLIHALSENSDGPPLTRRAICEASPDSLNTVKKYLRELIKQGVVHEDRSARTYTYSILKLPTADENLLLHPDELKARLEGVQSSHLPKPGQVPLGQTILKEDIKLNRSDQSGNDAERADCAT